MFQLIAMFHFRVQASYGERRCEINTKHHSTIAIGGNRPLWRNLMNKFKKTQDLNQYSVIKGVCTAGLNP